MTSNTAISYPGTKEGCGKAEISNGSIPSWLPSPNLAAAFGLNDSPSMNMPFASSPYLGLGLGHANNWKPGASSGPVPQQLPQPPPQTQGAFQQQHHVSGHPLQYLHPAHNGSNKEMPKPVLGMVRSPSAFLQGTVPLEAGTEGESVGQALGHAGRTRQSQPQHLHCRQEQQQQQIQQPPPPPLPPPNEQRMLSRSTPAPLPLHGSTSLPPPFNTPLMAECSPPRPDQQSLGAAYASMPPPVTVLKPATRAVEAAGLGTGGELPPVSDQSPEEVLLNLRYSALPASKTDAGPEGEGEKGGQAGLGEEEDNARAMDEVKETAPTKAGNGHVNGHGNGHGSGKTTKGAPGSGNTSSGDCSSSPEECLLYLAQSPAPAPNASSQMPPPPAKEPTSRFPPTGPPVSGTLRPPVSLKKASASIPKARQTHSALLRLIRAEKPMQEMRQGETDKGSGYREPTETSPCAGSQVLMLSNNSDNGTFGSKEEALKGSGGGLPGHSQVGTGEGGVGAPSASPYLPSPGASPFWPHAAHLSNQSPFFGAHALSSHPSHPFPPAQRPQLPGQPMGPSASGVPSVYTPALPHPQQSQQLEDYRLQYLQQQQQQQRNHLQQQQPPLPPNPPAQDPRAPYYSVAHDSSQPSFSPFPLPAFSPSPPFPGAAVGSVPSSPFDMMTWSPSPALSCRQLPPPPSAAAAVASQGLPPLPSTAHIPVQYYDNGQPGPTGRVENGGSGEMQGTNGSHGCSQGGAKVKMSGANPYALSSSSSSSSSSSPPSSSSSPSSLRPSLDTNRARGSVRMPAHRGGRRGVRGRGGDQRSGRDGKSNMPHRLRELEAEVSNETGSVRRERLVCETLAQLLRAKETNEDAEEGAMVLELQKQNAAIQALIYKAQAMKIGCREAAKNGRDPAAVLKITDEVLSTLNLPPPILPPNVVRIPSVEGNRRA